MTRRLSLRHPARTQARILTLALLLLITALLPQGALFAPAARAQETAPGGDAPLGEGQILIVGMELRPAPERQVVPRNTGTIVSPLLVRADQAPGQPAGELPNLPADAIFLGELRGPAFQTPVTISAPANGTFAIPPLPLDGLYTLSNIRLVSGGQVVLAGVPNTVQIEVIEKVIVSQVTARPLTAQEIKDRGIVVDETNFKVVDFTIGLGLQDEQVKITFPVLLPAKQETGYPGVPLPLPQGVGGASSPPQVPIPSLRLAFNSPNVEISGFSLEVPEPPEGKSRGLVSPLPGVVIIPGNIAYLNQFFSVLLKVSNVSPAYSNLTVRNLQAEIKLPPGNDGVVGTFDDPLRMANLGNPPAAQSSVQKVVQLGPDAKLGTEDDIVTIPPQANGDSEFLVEGKREGTHMVTIVMTGTLEGLPGGPVQIKGSAAGVVEVRNPQFSLTFHHPSVVTAGEEYDFDVTVTNISETPANFVSVSLLPRSLSGATLLSEQTQRIETIEANDSATVRWRLRALKTGAVVATSLNSDGIPGRFDLKMAVGELGIPMSPNTLVLPPTAAYLPTSLHDVALGLLGQAYALATSPFPPKGLLPLGRDMVIERATDFAAAGQRRQIGEPLPDMARDLLLDLLGNNYSRIAEVAPTPARVGLMQRDYQGFDTLLRKSRRGEALMAELAALFLPAVQQQGILPWQQNFATMAASRPGFFQAVTGNDGGPAPVVLSVTDGATNKLGMTEAGGPVLRAIPWGNFLTFANAGASYSQMALVAVPEPTRHTLQVVGTGSGQFDLGMVVPEGNRLRRVAFENVTIAEGGRGRVAFLMGSPNTYVLELDADGNGSYETSVQPAASELVTDPGPTLVAAKQVFIPNPRSHPSKYGVLLSVLFSEEISRDSSQEELNVQQGAQVTNFGVDANLVRGTKLQPRGRVVYIFLRDGVGPFVDRSLTASNIEDRLGNPMQPVSATVPIGMVLNGPAGTMEGTVRRADGTPVPNARIWYEGLEMDINDEPYWVMVSSKEADANGHYSFDYILKTGAKFTFIDPNTGERGVVGALPRFNGDNMHVDLVLRGRGSLTGRVLLQNGQPAAKAYVTVKSLYGEPDEQGYQVQTNESGSYLIGGIPVGPISIYATHAASRSQVQLASEIPSAGATVAQTLTVLPIDQPQLFGALQGQVFRADGVTPAANIPVYTTAGGMVTTDATGSYRIDRLVPGSVLIRAIDQERLETADVRTTIVASTTVTANLLLFGGSGTVTGVVLDAENLPLAGIEIYGGFEKTVTAADGSFVLQNMPVNNNQITALDVARNQMATANARITRPGEEVSVQIIMPVQGVLTGRVFKANGTTPVPNLKIFVLGPVNNVGYTDAQGNYRFEKLPRGEYTISAFYPDFSDGNVTFTKIVFKDEVRVANVIFRGRGTVTGIVYDDDGQTPLGARVGLSEWKPKIGKLRPFENPLCLSKEQLGVDYEPPKCEDVVVDWEFIGRSRRINNNVSSGTFTFNNVFLGDFLAEAANVFSPAVVKAPGEITKDGQTVPVTLTLYSTSIVTGVVYDIDGTTPMTAGIVVELDAAYIKDIRVATDAQGRFEFPLTSATGFQLTAMDGERELVGFASGSVEPGQDVYVPVRLLRKGSVTVLVNGANGPVTGATVTLSEGAKSGRRFTGATTNGSITFAGADAINEGMFSATAVLGGVRGSASGELKSVLLDPTGHVTVSITLANDVGSVQGRFLRGDGVTPIPNAQVQLRGPNGTMFATTNTLGEYRFDGVPMGSVTLNGADPVTGRRGAATGQLVTHGQLLTLNMIQIAQGSVTGVVRRSSDNAPVANASVQLMVGPPFQGTLRVTTNIAGEYTIPAVPATSFSVRADAPFGGYSGTATGSLALEGEVRGVDIVVQVPVVGRVVGVVTKADGSPAIGAVVRVANGGTTSVDNTGAYTIENVRLGPVTVFADAPLGGDGATATGTPLAFNGDVSRVNLQFSGTAIVQGLIRKADGSPAVGATVKVIRVGGYPSFNNDYAVNPGGAFTITNAPVGRLEFTAKQANLQLGGSLVLTLTQAGATVPVTITLEPAGTIAGRVFNENGTPASKVALEIKGPNNTQRFGSTNTDGTFAFADLKLGNYTVNVSDPLGTGIAMTTTSLIAQGQVISLTAIRLDEAPPAVVTITPTNGAIHVPVNQVIRVRFSEPVDPATIIPANLLVYRGAIPVAGAWALSENNTLASFTPAANYPDFANVSLRVKKAIKDRAGRTLPDDVVMSFTTTDSTPPAITSRSPLSGATNVELSAVVRIAWGEAIDPARFAAAPLRLLRNGQPVAGAPTLILNNTVAVLAPSSPLLPDSVYTVIVPPQRDAFGNTTGITDTYTFSSLDLTPPVISQLSAPDGTVVRAGTTARVVAQIAPGDQIAQVEFFVDGQSRAVVTAPPYEYTLPVPTSGLGAVVTARATDLAGNQSTAAQITFSIQPDLAPSVTLKTSAAGNIVSSGGKVTITVAASDEIALSTIYYQAKGAATGSGTTAVPANTKVYTATYVLNVPVTASPNTTITIEAKANDSLNQFSPLQTVVLTIADGTAPTVRFVSPATGTRVDPGSVVQVVVEGKDNGAVAAFQMSATGPASVQAMTYIQPPRQPVTVSIPVTIPANAIAGQLITLQARSIDVLGNQSTAATLLLRIKDVVAPTAALSVQGGAGEALPGATIKLNATATDAVGVTRVTLNSTGAWVTQQIQNFNPAQTSVAPQFTVTFPPTLTTNSTVTFTVTARDEEGNATTSAPVAIRIVPDAAPQVAVSAPLTVATSSPLTVSVAFTDDVGVRRLALTATGTGVNASPSMTLTPPLTQGVQSFVVNIPANAGGKVVLRATATDTRGQITQSAPFTVTVTDLTRPSLTVWNYWWDMVVLPGQNTLSVSASDNAAVASVAMTLTGGITVTAERVFNPATSPVSHNFVYTIPAELASYTRISVTVTAKDVAGNVSVPFVSRIMLQDVRKPVTQLFIKPGLTQVEQGQSFTVTVQATDDVDVDYLFLQSRGALVTDLSYNVWQNTATAQNTWTLTTPSSAVPGSVITLTASSRDSAWWPPNDSLPTAPVTLTVIAAQKRIVGVVTDSDGVVAGTPVTVTASNGVFATVVDASGQYTVSGVAPGMIQVIARSDDGRVGRASAPLFESETELQLDVLIPLRPTVAIARPISGTVLVEGQQVSVEISATSEIGIESADFFVNGAYETGLGNETGYVFSYTVPLSVTQLTFTALARDYEGNENLSAPVVVTIAADAGTTVQGRIVDEGGQPVAGASVKLSGFGFDTLSTLSGGDGTFSFPGVPTAGGAMQLVVRRVVNNVPLQAFVDITPVPGITDAGDITIRLMKVWDGGGDGVNWSSAANWNADTLPTVTDDVYIPLTATVRLDWNSYTINSLRSEGLLTLAVWGNLTINEDSVLNRLAMEDGTLAGAGTITVTQNLTWTAGAMNGLGKTVVLGETRFNGSGWASLSERTLENRGQWLWIAASDMQLSYGARIVNAAGATMVFEPSGSTRWLAWNSWSGQRPTLENNGTLIVQGPWMLGMQAALLNSGLVEVRSGLRLDQGYTNSGTLRTLAGTTLELYGGATLGGSLEISGTVANHYNTLRLEPAANQFAPSSLLRQGSGTLHPVTDLTVPSLLLEGGTLTGTTTLTATQFFTWTGGTMSGAGRTVSLGQMRLSSSNGWWLGPRTFENRGTAHWQMGTDFWFYAGGRIINAAGATWTIEPLTTNRSLVVTGVNQPPASVENYGTLRTIGATGTFFGVRFDNYGVVEVLGPALRASNGGANAGAMHVQAGSMLDLHASYTLSGTLALSGTVQATSGTLLYRPAQTQFGPQALVRLSGGVFTTAKAEVLPQFWLSSGTLTGTQTISVTQNLTWTGGVMDGAGKIVSLGFLSMSGNSNWHIYRRTLENRGAGLITMVSSDVYANQGARLVNAAGATLEVDVPGANIRSFNYYNNQAPTPTFENAGLLVKRGTGRLTVAANFTYTGSGPVDAQAGTLALNNGTVNGAITVNRNALLELNGTALTAASSIGGEGDVRFNSGAIAVPGTYNLLGVTFVAGGTVTFPDGTTPALGKQLRITGGTATLSPAQGIVLPELWISGGELSGSAPVTVTNVFTWTGGTMSGTGRTTTLDRLVATNSGSAVLNLFSRTLENRGQATWSLGAAVRTNQGARIINAPGALFEVTVTGAAEQSFAFFNNQLPRTTFDNFGTLVKKGVGPLTIQMEMNGYGSTDVQAGTYKLDYIGTLTGTIAVAEGAILDFAGTHAFTPNSSISGAGSARFNGAIAANGTYNVAGGTTINGGTLTFPPATQPAMGGVLRLTAGTLSVNSAGGLGVSQFEMSGGTLTGTATITATQNLTWTNGTMSGAGRTVATNRMVVNVGASTVTLTGRTLENRGLATVRLGGDLRTNLGARVVNAAGATMEVEVIGATERAFSFFNNQNPTGTFDNLGAFIKKGNGPFRVQMTANLIGATDVQSGTLKFDLAGTLTGTLAAAAGTTVDFNTGAYTLAPGSMLSGAGSVRFGSTVALNGGYNVTGATTVAAGALTIPPSSQPAIGGLLTLSGGTLSVNSSQGLAVARMIQSGTSVLTGTAPLTVTDWLTWTQGTMSGSGRTTALNRLAVPSAGALTLSTRTLENRGTGTMRLANNMTISFGGALVNAAGATLDVEAAGTGTRQFAWSTSGQGTRGSVVNYGALIKRGAIPLEFVTALNNAGVFTMQQGTVILTGGGAQATSGSTLVGAGTTLDYNSTLSVEGAVVVSGTVDFTPASSTVIWQPATADFRTGSLLNIAGSSSFLDVRTPLSVPTLVQSASTLTGTAPVTATNHMTWTGGTHDGAARTALLNTATFAAGGTKQLTRRTLDLYGPVAWTGGNINAFQGAAVNVMPGAALNISGSSLVLNWSTGNGTRPTLTNYGTILRSTATNDATIHANTVNSGTISIQNGGFNVQGAFTQGSAGTTIVRIDGPTNLTQLHRLLAGAGANAATLGGTLHIDRNPAYDPAVGTTLAVVTYASRTAGGLQFAQITGLEPFNGKVFTPSYGSTALNLLVANAPAGGGSGQQPVQEPVKEEPAKEPVQENPGSGEPPAFTGAAEWPSLPDGGSRMFLPLIGGGEGEARAESYSLRYIGAVRAEPGQPLALRARLRDAQTAQPLAGRTVLFAVAGRTLEAVTDAGGTAQASLVIDEALGALNITVALRPAADASAAVQAAAAEATTEASLFVGGLTPSSLTAATKPGVAVMRTTTGTVTVPPQPLDIVFSFDTTASMAPYLPAFKADVFDTLEALTAANVDWRAAIVSHEDYVGAFDSFGYSATYGVAGMSPYRLLAPLTSTLQTIVNGMNALQTVDAGASDPQTNYSRVLFESLDSLLTDANRKRVVLLFGDDLPHDNNLNEGVAGQAGTLSTGGDPGRDAQMGTADDLDLQAVVTQMSSSGIKLFYSTAPIGMAFITDYWNTWASVTGGRGLADYDAMQTALGEVLGAGPVVSNVRLVPQAGFEAWINVAPGAVATATVPVQQPFQVQITPPAGTAPGVYAFTLALRAAPQGLPDQALATATVTVTVGGTVDMSLRKSDGGRSRIMANDVVTYTLAYTNNGNVEATNVTLREVVPANTVFRAAGSSAGWSCANGSAAGTACMLNVGTVAAKATGTRTFVVQAVGGLAPAVSVITNTATISGTNAGEPGAPDPTPANNTATDTTSVNRAPVAVNDTLNAPFAAGNVPANVLANDSDADPGEQAALIITAISQPAHGTAAISGDKKQVLYTPAAGYAGPDSLTYTISDGRATAQGTLDIMVLGVDLVVTKSDGGRSRVMAGDVVTWTVRYTNTGAVAATGVVLRETVPVGSSFNAAASQGWACANGGAPGSECTFAVGTLAPQGAGAQIFAVTVSGPVADAQRALTNTVTIAASGAQGPDQTPANNTATDTTTLNHAPVAADDTLAVVNGSAAAPLNVRSNDSDSDGDALAIIAVTNPAHGTISTDGERLYYTPTVGYTGADSVTYTVSDGLQSETATVTIEVTGSPLAFEVTASPAAGTQVTPTQQIVYTLVARNGSASAFTALEIEAALPAETLFVSATQGCAAATPQPDGEGMVRWTAGTLASGASCTVQFTVVVSETALGTEIVQTSHASVAELSAASIPPVVTLHPLLASNVDIASFTVHRSGSDIQVFWETRAEKELAGFVIWRQASGGPRVPVNEAPIPSKGEPATYDMTDAGVPWTQMHQYWLEVRYNDGRTVTVGPRDALITQFMAMIISGQGEDRPSR